MTNVPNRVDPICFRCHRPPHQIPEYVHLSYDQGDSPLGVVLRDEGTYNPDTNTFACTDCYVAIGCPTRPHQQGGWKAPIPLPIAVVMVDGQPPEKDPMHKPGWGPDPSPSPKRSWGGYEKYRSPTNERNKSRKES